MNKKSALVSNRIINVLSESLMPLSIQQISGEVGSNWSTINEHIEELKNSGEVKEIVSADKIKLYQKKLDDTYFNIPLSKENREKFRTLFYYITQTYLKKYKKMPSKTYVCKAAVKVIKEKNIELPIVWYLYGEMTLMIPKQLEHYQEKYKFNNKEIIKSFIEQIARKYPHSINLQEEQYKNEELYSLKKKILDNDDFKCLNWNTEKEKVIEVFNELIIYCPTPRKFPDMFFLTDNLVMLINHFASMDSLEENKQKILIAFDSLWRYIASYKLHQSLSDYKEYSRKEILDFYISLPMETRKQNIMEILNELQEIYIDKIKRFDLKPSVLSKEESEIRNILSDWDWRE